MSTGSFNVWFDSNNRASKNWSGANGRRTENAYWMTHAFYQAATPQLWEAYWFEPGNYRPSGNGWWGNHLPSIPLSPWGNEELDALNKLAESLAGHHFNAGVAAGTSRQTADLIVSTSKRVLNAYRAARKGNAAECIRILGLSGVGKKRKLKQSDVGAFWLQLRYGWEPLLSDIHDACEAYHAKRAEARTVIKVQKSTRKQFVCNGLGDLAESTNTIKYKAIFREELSPLTSLGLMDPASVAWELVPFSFVVDWFVPVGSFLSAMGRVSGLQGEFVKSSYRRSQFKKEWGDVIASPLVMFKGGSYFAFELAFDREILSELSVPPPSMKQMEKALSTGHLQNAAALISALAGSLLSEHQPAQSAKQRR